MAKKDAKRVTLMSVSVMSVWKDLARNETSVKPVMVSKCHVILSHDKVFSVSRFNSLKFNYYLDYVGGLRNDVKMVQNDFITAIISLQQFKNHPFKTFKPHSFKFRLPFFTLVPTLSHD